MAFLFLNDNQPESSEYDSNYIYFDEKELGVLFQMMHYCLEKTDSELGGKKYDFYGEMDHVIAA